MGFCNARYISRRTEGAVPYQLSIAYRATEHYKTNDTRKEVITVTALRVDSKSLVESSFRANGTVAHLTEDLWLWCYWSVVYVVFVIKFQVSIVYRKKYFKQLYQADDTIIYSPVVQFKLMKPLFCVEPCAQNGDIYISQGLFIYREPIIMRTFILFAKHASRK